MKHCAQDGMVDRHPAGETVKSVHRAEWRVANPGGRGSHEDGEEPTEGRRGHTYPTRNLVAKHESVESVNRNRTSEICPCRIPNLRENPYVRC